jgi:HK97 family phage major capsid protein
MRKAPQHLYEQRTKAHANASSFLTRGEKQMFEAAMTEVDALTKKINTYETGNENFRTADLQTEIRRTEAFGKWVRGGEAALAGLSAEKRDVSEGGAQGPHIGTYSSLGYFVPTGFIDRVEQATKYYAPLTEDGIFQVIKTSSGNALPFPVSDDTAQAATIVGEGGSVNEQDLTASHVILQAYKLSSGVVKASIELLQDSAIDIEGWLSGRFGERFGRGLENFLTNGSGSAQPTGLLTALSANGVTPVIAAGQSTNDGSALTGVNSIGSNDLVNLEHSVDPSYRRNAKYMFADSTLAALKKILDKFGRPLWVPGLTSDDPDRIFGYQYVINQSMPSIAPSATTMVFGDLSKFVVRKVMPMNMQRLTELYAANGQVGFQAWYRIDSNLVCAPSTHPIGVLQQHS